MTIREEDDEEEVSGIFLTKTDRAILLDLGNGQNEWFPRSQITLEGNLNIDTLQPDDEISILVPVWLLRKRGL